MTIIINLKDPVVSTPAQLTIDLVDAGLITVDLTDSVTTTPAFLTIDLGSDAPPAPEPAPEPDPNIINAGWFNSWKVAQNALYKINKAYQSGYVSLNVITDNALVSGLSLYDVNSYHSVFNVSLDVIDKVFDLSFLDLSEARQQVDIAFDGNDVNSRFFNLEFGVPDERFQCETFYDLYQDGKYQFDLIDNNATTPSFLTIDTTPLGTYSVCKLTDNTDSLPVFTEIPIPETTVEPPEQPISPIKRRIYKLTHTINCYRSSDDLEVNIISATVSLDKSSTHYSFGLEFGTRVDAELIAGQEFKLIINGTIYKGIAETKSFSNSFGSESASLNGRSLSVLLTTPYALAGSGTNTTDKNWRQLIEAQAALAGFTVSYENFHSMTALDWLIPNNVFNYTDKTPLQAILQLCESVGALCHSHENLKQLIIKPAYPMPLWDLDSKLENAYIPENLQQSYSESDEIKPVYNGVHLQGEQQGVHVKIKRQGTAGDKLKNEVINPLFTANVACTERGITELSENGTVTNVQITTPVYAELPPINVGKIVMLERGVVETKYLTTGFSLSASRGVDSPNVVEQTLKMVRLS